MFTNTNAAHQAQWSKLYADVLKRFTRVFVSSELGKRKPEAAAFQTVCETIGVEPGRILFFDDAAANVNGARAAGLRAVKVENASDIVAALD